MSLAQEQPGHQCCLTKDLHCQSDRLCASRRRTFRLWPGPIATPQTADSASCSSECDVVSTALGLQSVSSVAARARCLAQCASPAAAQQTRTAGRAGTCVASTRRSGTGDSLSRSGDRRGRPRRAAAVGSGRFRDQHAIHLATVARRVATVCALMSAQSAERTPCKACYVHTNRDRARAICLDANELCAHQRLAYSQGPRVPAGCVGSLCMEPQTLPRVPAAGWAFMRRIDRFAARYAMAKAVSPRAD